MSWVNHNSHDSFYRMPFGAVTCNTNIKLRLKVLCKEEVKSVQLRLWQNSREISIKMEQLEQGDSAKIYEAEFNSGNVPGLLWYYFIVVKEGKVFYYGNNRQHFGGQGILTELPPPSYQITVYRQDFTVPKWFKTTVMYQIYVDRFFNGNENGSILNPRRGCLIHGSWDDTPLYVREPDSHAIRRWTFFGGNLDGIIKKLPYLSELGIGVIYLNPIFESSSNHKYDTGDYLKIDQMYGTNETFRRLCDKAREYKIRIVLDGVFSHTGSDSIYFNKEGSYDSNGAYQSKDSPYYRWYRFSKHPDSYESWWGITTLPNVQEMDPSYQDFMVNKDDSVVKYWMKMGASGWRLDVADELPDPFIKNIRQEMKRLDPESVLIGEVWEDASNKISYGETRAFLWGEELDSVMNYPFRRLFLDFMLGRKDACQLHLSLMSLYENYPKDVFYSTMNLLGSHDVARILTLLGEGISGESITESEKEKEKLSIEQRRLGIARLKMLSLIQLTFPGVPCIYYGDEAGMEGYSDPYNRGAYPWGREDKCLQAWYRKIIALRNKHIALREGEWSLLYAHGDVYGYLRSKGEEQIVVIVNRNIKHEAKIAFELPGHGETKWQNLLEQDKQVHTQNNIEKITIQPLHGLLLKRLSPMVNTE